MTTLTEFLLARLAEDAAAAEDAKPTRPDGSWFKTWEKYAADHDFDHDLTLRFDPARVLADVEAKRAIVSMSTWISNQERVPTDRPGVYDVVDTVRINEDMEPVLFALATVYADHPDFDESWRP